MKSAVPVLVNAAFAVIVPAWLLAVPVSARQTAAPSSGGSGGSASSGGSSGGSSHSGGGSSGGSPSGGASSGGGNHSGGGHASGGSSGGGGYTASRGGERTGAGGRTVGGGSGATSASGVSPAASNTPRPGETAQQGIGRAVQRPGSAAVAGSLTGTGDGVPPYSRPRDGHTPVGTAVPRGSVQTAPTGGGGVFIPGGYAFIPGGYYAGYGYYGDYDAYGPYGYGGSSGGYYGSYYDPWYGGYPTTPQASSTSSSDEGSLRLKIKPRSAEVYVDGYFVGVVDDFDGIFQRLHVESGTHRIELRAQGYEPLSFDVRITPEHTTTYQGELKRTP